MPLKMRRLYLLTIRERYQNAPKRQKSIILQEFCINCGYSRKYAIRILNGEIEPRMNKPGPKRVYGPQFCEVLHKLWLLMDCPGSRNMVATMPRWLPFIKGVDKAILDQLNQISSATIDRILRPFRKKRGISTTRPSMIKSRIPIELLDGDVTEPGYIEADTVAHCGDSAAGSFAYSITMTDLATGWTENRAVWTKASEPVLRQIKSIEERLPFAIKGFACDNGTEFLNENLETYFKNRLQPVHFVRRRPYKKNDSAHVEQKNYTHVRKLFGYMRIEFPELVPLMNEIYQAYWNPLKNYYTASFKLKEKVRIGSKVKRIYDPPKTPYDRLLEDPTIPSHIKRRLIEDQRSKNPFFLKAQLDKKLKELLDRADQLYKSGRDPDSSPLGNIFQ